MCIEGVCTTNPVVPQSTCPFGDDIVVSKVTIYTLNDLPSTQMTCEAAFDYGVASLQQVFCSDTNFKSNCCQFCKSKNNFLSFLVLKFFFSCYLYRNLN